MGILGFGKRKYKYLGLFILFSLEESDHFKYLEYNLVSGDDMGKGKGGRGQSRNDQRSNSMNPNNPAHQGSQDNRSDQLNPNNPEHKGSGKKEK